jgi:predicted phage gp36 major capsid-like protein
MDPNLEQIKEGSVAAWTLMIEAARSLEALMYTNKTTYRNNP